MLMNSTMHILKSPQEIDLSLPGIMEAHAGTGKTYTIVQLVLRILQQPQQNRFIHIREILLVTYTDKAAGELQSRIREGLEKCIADLSPAQSVLHTHLSDCLNNLHEAFIGTIHGVCQRLLRTWPFETHSPFQTEMASDGDGLEQTLRTCIRTDWQQESTQIPWALAQLGNQKIGLKQKHFDGIVEIASKLLDRQNAELNRRSVQGHNLASLRQAMEQTHASLESPEMQQDLIGKLQTLQDLIARATMPKKSNPEALEAFHALPEKLQKLQQHPELARQQDWIELFRYRKSSSNRALEIFLKDFGKDPSGAAVVSAIVDLQGSTFANLQEKSNKLVNLVLDVLICDAAEILSERWNSFKETHCLLSFQDMLSRMAKASNSFAFRTALRERLRYGIIDEFQDTSVLQWSIFRNLFFENGAIVPNSTLYLVGDPKQSIYAFQGADVCTYMDARRFILDCGGRLYGLVQNYRSTQDLIGDYNRILGNCDWFRMSGIDYPMPGAGGQMAEAPARKDKPTDTWSRGAVQILPVQGNARKSKQRLAESCAHAIQSLLGTTLQVPKGDSWTSLTLDPSHFAVIVETHSLAEPFLAEFRKRRIPATKYKLQGVFQSPMARDLTALLFSIASETSQSELRIPALLTRFYNLHPSEVEPERDLDQNAALSRHITEWQALRDRRRWGQLFGSIQSLTHISERLALLQDGDRHLADWRQLVDFSLQFLVRENHSLPELAEHLHRLLLGEERATDEQNLHMLSTGLASVKVLTMHASKGLEFPVVFVIPAGEKGSSAKVVQNWMGDDRKSQVILANSKQMEELFDNGLPPNLVQANQERRRLLYVALTRPQFLLFLPLQLKPNGSPYESILTPRLQELQSEASFEIFRESEWPISEEHTLSVKDVLPQSPPEFLQAESQAQQVRTRRSLLQLTEKHSHQTSYTELSHGIPRDHQLSPSEELETPVVNMPSALPGGKDTGDALHLVLEECLGQQNIAWDRMRSLLEGHLENNGVLARLATPEEKQLAVDAGLRMIRLGMESKMNLSALGSTDTILRDLPISCRKAELEFQLQAGPDWVHGFMDLVFRLPAPGFAHPWRYYILDWKSNSLEKYDQEQIAQSIRTSHYDLQAKLYLHALHLHLQGLLGSAYDPTVNLGGAVYVYLRAFEHQDHCQPWLLKSDVVGCAQFVQEQLHMAFPRNAQGVPYDS